MLRIQPRSQPPVALGQSGGGVSPIWYAIGGAVAWAVLGDVLRGAGRVAGRGAQYGLAKVEKKIPAARDIRSTTDYEVDVVDTMNDKTYTYTVRNVKTPAAAIRKALKMHGPTAGWAGNVRPYNDVTR